MANEKRLIDIEQAKRATYEEVFWSESEQAVVRNFLAKLPKVDAVEVVHGWWEKAEYYGWIRCDKCKDVYLEEGYLGNGKWSYCPNCGAKMDGGNEDV